MPFHSVTPTRAAGTWDTETSAVIDYVIKGPLDYMQMACPTLQLLMQNSKTFDLGPDGKVGWNYLKDMYSTYVGHMNQVYALPDLDPVSRLEFTVAMWYGSMSTNMTEVQRYRNANRSLVDLVAEKMQAVQNGITHNINFQLFWDWDAADIVGGVLDTEAGMALSPLPPPTRMEGVNVNTDLIYSIPMCIRPHVTGHTFGNVSSSNAYWVSAETNGAAPTRSAAGNNIDCVTAQGVPVALGVNNIRTHLQKVQIGAGLRLYAPLPADLYGMLEDYILAERRRDANDDNAMADLGIDTHFVYREYNTVFYLENMMTFRWPNSIWFWDNEAMFLGFESGFNPFTSPLERLPHSTIQGAATDYHGNLMCIARTGASAMHGWASE